jgi:hypothetical protein
MKTLSRTETFDAAPEIVFKAIDDLGVTGSHMTQSSAMMMGSKLHLEYLSTHHAGLGTKYRWTGKMMGIKMDFTVEVTQWIAGREKIWETIGRTKLILYSWYRMNLITTPIENGTEAQLSITYKKPEGFLNSILSFLFADLYCRWCLKKMLQDARIVLEQSGEKTRVQSSSV